ncbi:MAG: type II secretion system F family protein [Candidatus Brocadia sp.]|jgi:type IV pilus assembly protein PilC
MSHFEIKAVNSYGEFIVKRIRARNAEEAINKMKSSGFFPLSLSNMDIDGNSSSAKSGCEKSTLRKNHLLMPTCFQGISKKDILGFTRKLRIFTQSNIPVYQSLNILQTQTKKGRLIKLIQYLAENVASGKSLAESLASYPKYFHKLYIGLIHAGEVSGNLTEVLTRLENYLETTLKRKSKLISASLYPSIVIVMTFGIISLLNVFIIPKFKKAYQSLQIELPKITSVVLSVSTWLSAHWYVLFLIPIATFVTLKLIRFSRYGRYLTDYSILIIPLIGLIVRKSNLSLFYRTNATLLQSGVMILDSLKMSGSVIKNVVINKEIDLVIKGVYEGKIMNDMMKRSWLFDAFAVHMVEVGETSGMLHEMLEETADVYDEELDILYKRLEGLLEPFIILILAGIVGTVVIALYMPMVKLTQTLGNIK